jgi:type IV pilus assembly protein PilN
MSLETFSRKPLRLSSPMINLASQPFRRERAANAAFLGLCIALTCSLVALGVLILHERAQAADLRRMIDHQQADLNRLEREQARYTSVLGKPQNADVFATSVFLNEVIARRSVSWTRAFADLEKIMPYNVRLVTVRLPQVPAPEEGGVNHVQLDMVVGTDKPEAVLDLLKRLQSSPLFGSASLMNSAPPTQNDPLYRYRITVAYAQKL